MVAITYRLGEVRLNQRGLDSVLRSQRGPVAKHIRAVGAKTVIKAKMLSGVRTGQLKKSIKMTRDRRFPVEYAVLVGSDVRHALVHHQGARRHKIVPRNPGGVLVFNGKRGRVVTTRVNHPGHKANRYLVNALRMAVRR